MGDDLAAGVQNLDEKLKFNQNLDFNSQSSTEISTLIINSHSSTKISTLIVIVQPKSQL